MLISPALIPNKQIFRYNPNTDSEYYVYFSTDTVRKASELYLKYNNHHKATYQHQDRVAGVLTVESWIKEGDQDKSKMYGYDLPNGTWFVKMKIENNDLWKKIKAGELKGLSIEGYFVDKMEKMSKTVTDEEIVAAYNELVKEGKINKVELGVVQDIQKLIEDFKDIAKEENELEVRKAKVIQEYKPLVTKSKKLISVSTKLIKEVTKQAKELGIKTKDIGKFDVLQNFIKSAEKIEQRYKKTLKGI